VEVEDHFDEPCGPFCRFARVLDQESIETVRTRLVPLADSKSQRLFQGGRV
jgi:hypothetical protein